MDYVVITGASSGLGAEFARQLAEQGYGLVLVARRQDALQRLADNLSSQMGVDCRVIAQDLGKPGAGQQLAERIRTEGIPVVGLINNAGFGDNGRFDALSLDRQQAMMQLNNMTLVELTYCLLPQLRQRSGAFVINVASIAAFLPGPFMAVYYASKAFVRSFSEALKEELEGEVQVLALCPGPTRTEFSEQANLSDNPFFNSLSGSPERVVREALKKRHRATVVPGFLMAFTVRMAHFLPGTVVRKAVSSLQKKS